MVSGTIVAGEPGAIHAEEDRQLLQTDVMHDGIEGPLQEGRVYGADRPETLSGHARGEYDRVLLGDAHIEVALGKVRPEKIEPCPVRHGRGDGHDALVLGGQIGQSVGEDLSVCGQAGWLGHAGLGIVGPQAVKLFLLVQRRLKAAALLREHMQQHRVIDALEKLKGFHKQGEVVAVDGTEVL